MFITLLVNLEGVIVDKSEHITHDTILSYIINVNCQTKA